MVLFKGGQDDSGVSHLASKAARPERDVLYTQEQDIVGKVKIEFEARFSQVKQLLIQEYCSDRGGVT